MNHLTDNQVFGLVLIAGALGLAVGWWAGRSYGFTESENKHRADEEKKIPAAKLIPDPPATSDREQLVAYVARHPIRRRPARSVISKKIIE